MLKAVKSKGTSQIAVVTESESDKWRWKNKRAYMKGKINKLSRNI
jgi:hypothetical protein